MKRYFCFLVFSLFIFCFVFAQSTFKFFEFSPRSQDNFQLQDQTFIQPFIPFNDYLSAIGFWLANPSITSINLKIIDNQNQIIVSKDFELPIIQQSWWGEEFVFDLGQNFPLVSGNEYKIIISPQRENNLTFFAKNLLEILQGSESYLYFPETLKPLKINNNDTNFSLKFSLYENREYDPPIISNLEIIFETATKTKITFNSNEPIIYTLDYQIQGTESQASSSISYFENCPPMIRKCLIEINTLPNQNYFYRLKAIDFWNNQTIEEGNFQTPGISQMDSTTTLESQGFSSGQTSDRLNIYDQTQPSYQGETFFGLQEKRESQPNFGYSFPAPIYLKTPTSLEKFYTSTQEQIIQNQITSTFNQTTTFLEKQKESGKEKINKFQLIKEKIVQIFWLILIFALIFVLLVLSFKFKIFKKSNQKAFTLLEVVLALLILSFSAFLIFLLVSNISNFNTQFIFSLGPQREVIQTLDEISRELRAVQNSNLGSYPIILASTTKIVFYSDIDNDGLVEEISYYLENQEFKKSIIVPSGNPLTYDPNQAKVITKVTDLILPQQIFSYYDENFQETFDLSKIKLIKVSLKVRHPSASNVFSSYVMVAPRNLLFK